jgi:hypothetical protein
MIIITAALARLVACPLIAQRVATCWRCGRWRRGCCRSRCLGRRWCGRCSGWRRPCDCPTCRTRVCGHVRQRVRARGAHVVAGVGCDVADLCAVACAQPSGRYRILRRCQAFLATWSPNPFAAEPPRSRGNSGGDRADVDIARRRPLIAGVPCRCDRRRGSRYLRACAGCRRGRYHCRFRRISVAAQGAGYSANHEHGSDDEEEGIPLTRKLAARALTRTWASQHLRNPVARRRAASLACRRVHGRRRAGELHLLRMASLVWPQPDQRLSRGGSASIPTAARGYSNQPLPFALSAIWFRVQSRECNAEAAEAATSRPSRPGTFFTSITAFRFVRELVAFPPVLTGLYDEITDKANARGWCGYRPLAPPSLPLRNEDQRPRSRHINGLKRRKATGVTDVIAVAGHGRQYGGRARRADPRKGEGSPCLPFLNRRPLN